MSSWKPYYDRQRPVLPNKSPKQDSKRLQKHQNGCSLAQTIAAKIKVYYNSTKTLISVHKVINHDHTLPVCKQQHMIQEIQ